MSTVPYLNALLAKRGTFPTLSVRPGDSKQLALQLDGVLVENGHKMTVRLFRHVAESHPEDAQQIAEMLLHYVREAVGSNVKHNAYFQAFPKHVPSTESFWYECIIRYFVFDEVLYGRYQHTYEQMLEVQSQLVKPKDGMTIRFIDLGSDYETERLQLCESLAQTKVPLNEADRALLLSLLEVVNVDSLTIVNRETKAIVNAARLARSKHIQADTVTDVLRVACVLSGGDVTLATPTKFKSFSKAVRRELMSALNLIIDGDSQKAADAMPHAEAWKRLRRIIHPGQFAASNPHAMRVFNLASGTIKEQTYGSIVQDLITQGQKTGCFVPAIHLLQDRPGMLIRQVDLILRDGSTSSASELMRVLTPETLKRVSGRVILSLIQHLRNRTDVQPSRLFVNRKGKAFARADHPLKPLQTSQFMPVQLALEEALKARITPIPNAFVSYKSLMGIAIPLSEKSQSDGLDVLPRGSVFCLEKNSDPAYRESLRFFMHWHQKQERTDYDLSSVYYDADFQFRGQVSWTNLRFGGEGTGIVHSGDLVDATHGATEFIDIPFHCVPDGVKYIVPSVNHFAGENYADCLEASFGFMVRPNDTGLPFEPSTVQTKFRLRGTKKVALPMVFMRVGNGWMGKWLDVYMQGLPCGNMVERNKVGPMAIAHAIINRQYLDMVYLADLLVDGSTQIEGGQLPDTPVTYIGLRRPDGLHPESKVYTLSNFRELIPA